MGVHNRSDRPKNPSPPNESGQRPNAAPSYPGIEGVNFEQPRRPYQHLKKEMPPVPGHHQQLNRN